MSLKGKVALVTGSTSGIGLAIARALAAEGATLMLNGFAEPTQIAAIRAEIGALGGTTPGYSAADISRPEQIAEMVGRAEQEFGRVDILVNNAGVQFVADIADFPTEQWDRVSAINLSGAFHASKAVIPGMKARRWGRIINIASAHSLVASAQKAAYVAAKHGVMGLTKVAAIELANDGITCNAICPGWVLTPLVQQQVDARAAREGADPAKVAQAMITEKQPMAKFSTPESIAAVAVFLCSDAAATITGAPISVDGGWVAQ